MSKQINVSEESYRKFQAALILAEEEEEVVMSKLISEYSNKVFENVMGKKAVDDLNENNQIKVQHITADEQKQLFVNWFRCLTRNGKSYNPVTISGYTGRIENACCDPTFVTVPFNNLFTITDLSQFIDVQKQIKNCVGYIEFDAKSHNGFTAALRKYEDFLRFQASGNSIKCFPTANSSYSQPSNSHRWTIEEDSICCKRFIEYYVIKKSNIDTMQFLQMLSKEVPDVSEGSLRMKIQNVKYLAARSGLKDTSTLKWLSQYSRQCEKAFKKALLEMGIK